jgi:hypothetical protein
MAPMRFGHLNAKEIVERSSNMERSSQQLMEIFTHIDSRKHIPLQKECNT